MCKIVQIIWIEVENYARFKIIQIEYLDKIDVAIIEKTAR